MIEDGGNAGETGKWLNDIAPWALVAGAGMLGRLMNHAKMVQTGKRKPLSWALLWDLPIALGSGWVAYGVAVYLHFAFPPTISFAIVASYLGPYAIDTLFEKWTNFKFGRQLASQPAAPAAPTNEAD